MAEWDGTNDYGSLTSYVYSLKNKIYRNSVMIKLPDLEDDQTGALKSKARELSDKAKVLENREVMKCLASGISGTYALDGTVYGSSFDTLNYFANRTGTNGFGTGNNLLTTYTTLDAGTSSPTHATSYWIAAIYHGPQNKSLRPMVWQQRSGPNFFTNMGTVQSEESLQMRAFATRRGTAGYGIWYNSVLQPFLGLPNVSEVSAAFALIEAAYRTFQLPKTRSTTFGQYVFEQTKFNSSNLTFVGSTALGEPLRQALTQDWAPQTIATTSSSSIAVADTNRWKGFANYLISAYFNAVS
jgi:phage major head subunit gpT-like protein